MREIRENKNAILCFKHLIGQGKICVFGLLMVGSFLPYAKNDTSPSVSEFNVEGHERILHDEKHQVGFLRVEVSRKEDSYPNAPKTPGLNPFSLVTCSKPSPLQAYIGWVRLLGF